MINRKIFLSCTFVLCSILHFSEFARAQDSDDAYDPFSDYAEYDDGSDEEADINFFRNGRFLTIGLMGGPRTFTGNLGKLYSDGPTYGLSLASFFDMRFALQVSFLTGDYGFQYNYPSGLVTGNVSMTWIDLGLKYYLNTQNVTKGLADWNPYFLGGFSEIFRTLSLTATDGSSRDSTVGLHFGGGIEFPILRRKAYLGVQAEYRYFAFADANQQLVDPQTQVPTTTSPSGNSIDGLIILGFNF